jgi:tRNA threonylcarbamoyladenosine biosynthesis protein TsaB
MILSLDTAGEFGSLALYAEGAVREEMPLYAPDGFSGILFPQIEALLARHRASYSDVRCFAAVSGPGAFTGLRVGLAAVKGLAEATGSPVVALSRLRLLASFGTHPLRAPLLDARRGQIYGALYDAGGNLVLPESVEAFSAWLETLPASRVEFLAHDFSPFAAALEGTPFAHSPATLVPRSLAGALATLAAIELSLGRAQDPASIDANYVRRSDAEQMWTP